MMNNTPTVQNTPSKFSSLDIISEAWQLTSGLKWPIFLLLVLIPIAYFILLFIGMFIFIPYGLFYSASFLFISACISSLVMFCVYAIANLLGVKQALHLPIDIDETYNDCMRVKEKLFFFALFWVAIVGMIALFHIFFPGILIGLFFDLLSFYLTLPLLIFTLPLIVMRNVELNDAIHDSFRKMNSNFIQIMTCYFIMMVLITISAIPLGIGLIWTVPMYNAMTGILFRNAYGLKQ